LVSQVPRWRKAAMAVAAMAVAVTAAEAMVVAATAVEATVAAATAVEATVAEAMVVAVMAVEGNVNKYALSRNIDNSDSYGQRQDSDRKLIFT